MWSRGEGAPGTAVGGLGRDPARPSGHPIDRPAPPCACLPPLVTILDLARGLLIQHRKADADVARPRDLRFLRVPQKRQSDLPIAARGFEHGAISSGCCRIVNAT